MLHKEWTPVRKNAKRVFIALVIITVLMNVQSLIYADDFESGVPDSQLMESAVSTEKAEIDVTPDITPSSSSLLLAVVTPTPGSMPASEVSPEPTLIPDTTQKPDPTSAPEVTPLPSMTPTPTLTSTPTPTPTFTPTPTPTSTPTPTPTPTLLPVKTVKKRLKVFGDRYLNINPVKSNKVEISLQNVKKANQYILKYLQDGWKKTQINVSVLAVNQNKDITLLKVNKKLKTVLQKSQQNKPIGLKLKSGKITTNTLYRTIFQMIYPLDKPVKSSSYRYFCGIQFSISIAEEDRNGIATVKFKLPKKIEGVDTITIQLLGSNKKEIQDEDIDNKSGSTINFKNIKKNTRYYYKCLITTKDKKNQPNCANLGLGTFIISTGNSAAKAKGINDDVEQTFYLG